MKRKAYYTRKIKRAAQLLFYKRHMKPGVKGWELKNALGSDYLKVLKVLDNHLEKLDLQVKTVIEGEEPKEKLTLEELRAFCKNQLASYKLPKLIEYRMDLP